MNNIDQKLFSVNRQQEEKHTKELADRLGMPYADLLGYPFAESIFEVLPLAEAIEYKAIPFLKIGNNVKIGFVEVENPATKTLINKHSINSGLIFTPTVISNTSFLFGLRAYQINEQKKKSSAGEPQAKPIALTERIKTIEDVAKTARTVNVSQELDVLLVGAVRTLASDVHLEPGESNFKVRYRIDGVLTDVTELPMSSYHGLISRIKFLAKMKLDIIKEPQDGRFSITIVDEQVDIRVATMPSAYGESVVLRLLEQDRNMQKLDNLGFRPEAIATIRQAIKRPHGMILNTGPTGSGKTTTLYAILLEIRKPGIKIITLEDPIEYRIKDVEQSQIDADGQYTFAQGLKGALRADPDVIMVGEVRDTETARIAVQAALTGHLLLSTVHANSASAVYPRLLDIGVKPFLLAGSINLVMAQRLVRLICPHCKEEFTPPEPIWLEIKHSLLDLGERLPAEIKTKLNSNPKLYQGKGCPACNSTGFAGRQAIVEVLCPNAEIEALVARQATQAEFTAAAVKQGMISMEADGLMKAILGLTTPEEVWRVTRE